MCAHLMKFQDIQLKSLPCSGSAQVNVKFSVTVMYVRLLTLTSSLLAELEFFLNEQRSRDAAAKKIANTSGVGKSNNYYEDIYIPPYSNTH